MARPKGSKNKSQTDIPPTFNLTIEARIELLANIIVDRILQDKRDDQPLPKKLED